MPKDIWVKKDFINIQSMITIKLKQLRFFAHHGLYEEERKVSNEFMVDLEVSFESSAVIITKMNETINYIKLYDLIKKHMLQTTDLIETLAMKITDDIHDSYPQVKKVSIAITKKYPPVINFSGNVAVSYLKEFP
jgi:7,8-dihydroneopterin aldolase/epimerase/oxygenase